MGLASLMRKKEMEMEKIENTKRMTKEEEQALFLLFHALPFPLLPLPPFHSVSPSL